MFGRSADYQKILQKGGQVNYISDLSGTIAKKKRRLIYLLEANVPGSIKFVIKITPKEFDDTNEINIHKELSGTQFTDQIIKYYGDGDFPILQNQNRQDDFQINLDVPCISNKIVSINCSGLDLWNEIIQYQLHHANKKFQYLVMEYDDNYKTLKDQLPHIPNSQKCLLFENIAQMLLRLNTSIGFSHWDLHRGNVLIDKTNPVNFKLFDFGRSSTNKNFSNTLFSASMFAPTFFGKGTDKNKAGKIDTPEFGFRLRYGFLFDLGLIHSLKLANSGCTINQNLLDTIINYIDHDNNIKILKGGQRTYTKIYNILINSLPGVNNDGLTK